MVLVAPFVTLVSLSALTTLASAVTVQKPLLQLSADAAQNRKAVKDIFLYSYNAYKWVFPEVAMTARLMCYRNDAWGHDDVNPVSQGFSDDRNGWGATIIDSLSTMVGNSFPFSLRNGR
jgi:mannosyl-oligosaccharide alpha-1,2-mannosidase